MPTPRRLGYSGLRNVVAAFVVAAICLVGLGAGPALAAGHGRYVVTMKTPDESPLVGQPFSITGDVTPSAKGAAVQLQRYVDGHFSTVATTRLDGRSRYAFTQSGPSVGAYIYRVSKAGHKHTDGGVSPQQRVWVTGDRMVAGPVMHTGEGLISVDGSYRLLMQANGNLSILLGSTGRLVWSMQTAGHPGAWAVLQHDGNLVVHARDGTVLRSTGTGGHPADAYGLRIREDSDLVITTPGGSPFWSSDTVNSQLAAHELLLAGQHLRSPSGRFQIDMNADGNVTLTDTGDRSIDWATSTDEPGSSLVMQPTGDMEVVGPFGEVLWTSGTDGFAGAGAVLQDDGNFVIYQGGVARWSSRGDGGVLGDDYPAYLRDADRDSLIDPWRFYNRECTSFVAWRMNSANHVDFSNFMDGGHFGNAYNWDDNARALGYVVDSTPARGAIAESDSEGHVAWVAAVGDGTVTVEDYNYSSPGNYGTRVVPTSRYRYIHIKDLGR